MVQQSGWSATTLHSDKTQTQREAALQQLRDGEVQVLVATDVAGRGLDVPDVCKYCSKVSLLQASTTFSPSPRFLLTSLHPSSTPSNASQLHDPLLYHVQYHVLHRSRSENQTPTFLLLFTFLDFGLNVVVFVLS